MIKYLTEWLQWSYYHAPLIPQTRYIKHVIILILLVYILAVFDIRGFLNGMSLFYLTKRQRQKNGGNRQRTQAVQLGDGSFPISCGKRRGVNGCVFVLPHKNTSSVCGSNAIPLFLHKRRQASGYATVGCEPCTASVYRFSSV